MPELPEVEVIRRDLVRSVEGRRIHRAKIAEARLTRRRGAPREVEAALRGQRIRALRRRGKFFVFDLGKESLIVRLGMTGQLLWSENGEGFRPDQYTHAELIFEGGGILYYRDIRKFGEMFILPTASVEDTLRVGVEPLGPTFTAQVLQRMCRSASKIKPLLLNQTKIAGIGNIYADEALFRAGIRPTRRAASLRREEIRPSAGPSARCFRPGSGTGAVPSPTTGMRADSQAASLPCIASTTDTASPASPAERRFGGSCWASAVPTSARPASGENRRISTAKAPRSSRRRRLRCSGARNEP